jgi:hypothetical protein
MDGMMDPYGYGRGDMRYAPGYGVPMGYGAPPGAPYASPYPAPAAVVAYGAPRGGGAPPGPFPGYGYAGGPQPAAAAYYPPGGFAGYG